jgi:hypothetical protein
LETQGFRLLPTPNQQDQKLGAMPLRTVDLNLEPHATTDSLVQRLQRSAESVSGKFGCGSHSCSSNSRRRFDKSSIILGRNTIKTNRFRFGPSTDDRFACSTAAKTRRIGVRKIWVMKPLVQLSFPTYKTRMKNGRFRFGPSSDDRFAYSTTAKQRRIGARKS